MTALRERDWDSGWWSGIVVGAVGALTGRTAYNMVREGIETPVSAFLSMSLMMLPVLGVSCSFRPDPDKGYSWTGARA